MRTTLEIDDDVMDAARQLARLKNQGIGRSISDLARRGLAPKSNPTVELRHRIPTWTHGPGAIPVTTELVRNLADEECFRLLDVNVLTACSIRPMCIMRHR